MPLFEPALLDDIRDRVPISQIIGQRVTWDRKKTSTARGDYWACCPFHGEKSPSFHCEDKKGRYHCFGCGVSGDHFRFLMEIVGMSFQQAVADVADLAGIQLPGSKPPTDAEKAARAKRAQQREADQKARAIEAEKDKAERVMSAGLIWKQSVPIIGTLAEFYLEWRCPGLCPKTETEIRFHPSLEMDPDNPRGDQWPAMIARVCDQFGKGIAVWRIYLNRDGTPRLTRSGKKIKLGYGPSKGGAVRLGGISDKIGGAEGVETALAVRALGVGYPVWSLLSTSGLIGFQFPEQVKRFIYYRDPDGSKIKFKERPDGTEYLSQAPGQKAFDDFVKANSGRDIKGADVPHDSDALEMLQKLKGVPVR